MTGFQVVHGLKSAGFFALALIAKQARLVGAWLAEPTAEHWRITLQLAQQAAGEQAASVQFVMRTGVEEWAQAGVKAGLRVIGSYPVFLMSKQVEPLPLQF